MSSHFLFLETLNMNRTLPFVFEQSSHTRQCCQPIVEEIEGHDLTMFYDTFLYQLLCEDLRILHELFRWFSQSSTIYVAVNGQ